MTFKALLMTEGQDGPDYAVTDLEEDRLPEGDVLVDVEYSTLNYKDGMILGGNIGRLALRAPEVGRQNDARPPLDQVFKGRQAGVNARVVCDLALPAIAFERGVEVHTDKHPPSFYGQVFDGGDGHGRTTVSRRPFWPSRTAAGCNRPRCRTRPAL